MGGELLAAILAEKQSKEKKRISPCEGCSCYKECEKEGRFKLREDRLDTDSLEVQPLNKDDTCLLAEILMTSFDDAIDWVFDPNLEFDPDVKDKKLEIPWIIKVIRKRIIGENLKIEITKKAYFLLLILTKGNPGKAMFILHKIGNLFEKVKSQQWLVT